MKMNKEQIDDIEYVRKNLMKGLKTPPTKDKVKTKTKMKNNIEDISREVLRLVDEWKHGMPINNEMAEMEIIHYIAHILQPQLETKEDIKKA